MIAATESWIILRDFVMDGSWAISEIMAIGNQPWWERMGNFMGSRHHKRHIIPMWVYQAMNGKASGGPWIKQATKTRERQAKNWAKWRTGESQCQFFVRGWTSMLVFGSWGDNVRYSSTKLGAFKEHTFTIIHLAKNGAHLMVLWKYQKRHHQNHHV